MDLDDELCLCFHVTKRKVVKFIRLERPHAPSQLAECFGAGSGCGWCRPFLKKLFDAHRAGDDGAGDDGAGDDSGGLLPDATEYAAKRAAYVRAGKGTPPT